ncbi:dienelactone hydrolase family protein [Nannocystis sp.]|uniref:dienelactone hydrolase family protein n=1 Tax=Nannocystis sp. TaxID=1962667 RepID=UPI0025E744DE|nr:dienelactone hydrolase family protein [Nannocystis sp.]MBK7825255.1 dienelactone hydrolase family protein [Nannocystis sp.]
MRRLALLPLLLLACSQGGDGDDGTTAGPVSITATAPSSSESTPTTDNPGGTTAASGTTTAPGTSSGLTSDGPTGGPTSDATTDPTTDPPASTSDGDSSTGAPLDPNVNVDPSNGMGGTISPGSSSLTPLGAEIYIPTTYDPQQLASPVIWLFNETLDQWQNATLADAAILVDLHEYNDTNKIVAKLNETLEILDAQYNVDRGRYYWAGWSAGGNLVIIIGSENQDTLAGTMVFPGTGGNFAQDALASWNGHKLRMYYACGSEDPNFDANAVQFEAETWKNKYGYTTRFDLVPGAPHYLDEPTYKVRDAAWQWMRGFNLKN